MQRNRKKQKKKSILLLFGIILVLFFAGTILRHRLRTTRPDEAFLPESGSYIIHGVPHYNQKKAIRPAAKASPPFPCCSITALTSPSTNLLTIICQKQDYLFPRAATHCTGKVRGTILSGTRRPRMAAAAMHPLLSGLSTGFLKRASMRSFSPTQTLRRWQKNMWQKKSLS